jgi:RimJ/RimL family protein N-acetyltransferase
MITNPRLLDFPEQIESDRLLLRPLRHGDGQIINDALGESLNELRPWMPWASRMQTLEESEDFARRSVAEFSERQILNYLMIDRFEGLHIGNAGFHNIDWSVPSLELGYWVRTSQQGQGYVTEAVLAMTGFAFEIFKAERLEIRCDSRNTRSAAVALRAGYTLEGHLRHQRRDHDGNLRDTLIYARLRGSR